MASQMKVDELALVPFSFPTYANALGRAVITLARDTDELVGQREHEPDMTGPRR
jgi:hypothetical protein